MIQKLPRKKQKVKELDVFEDCEFRRHHCQTTSSNRGNEKTTTDGDQTGLGNGNEGD